MATKKDQEVWNCLTVYQPYAWAIVIGAKDIENRRWKSNHRGRLYIHAGRKECNESQVDNVTERVARHLRISMSAASEAYRSHRAHGLGAIVGSVRMVGCATSYDSEWFEGTYGFILCDSRTIQRTDSLQGTSEDLHVQTLITQRVSGGQFSRFGRFGRSRYASRMRFLSLTVPPPRRFSLTTF